MTRIIPANLVLAGVAYLSLTNPAQAYLDPGTGSIILQGIIGAVAASLFIARSYLYKAMIWLGIKRKTDDKPPSK